MKSRFYTLYIKIRENDLACCCFCYLHKQEAQLSELSSVKLLLVTPCFLWILFLCGETVPPYDLHYMYIYVYFYCTTVAQIQTE